MGSSPWEVTAGGTLGFDDLTTPAGRAATPGGSALYFSLAARRRCPVHAVAAIGRDGLELRALLEGAGVDTRQVEVRPGRTYRWRAVHGSSGGSPVEEHQMLGVYRSWRPQPGGPPRRSRLLFLGSMPPRCQRLLLRAEPGAGLVALDTMRDYITGHGRQLGALLAEVDLLFLNGPELSALAGGDPLRLLGRGRLRALVVKEGAEGARLITGGGDWWVAPPAVRRVVDPTGAGDALAGGMLGRLAELRRTDPEALLEALAAGTLAAGAAIEAFGPKGLLASREEGSVPL